MAINGHGKGMDEGKAANDYASEILRQVDGKPCVMFLWAPNKSLEYDQNGRILAVVYGEPDLVGTIWTSGYLLAVVFEQAH
jgi:hypothetical protein